MTESGVGRYVNYFLEDIYPGTFMNNLLIYRMRMKGREDGVRVPVLGPKD